MGQGFLRSRVALGMFAMLVSLPVLSGNGVWTTAGPWGGTANQVEAHPTNTSRVYALGPGGLFRSDDAGGTWVSIEKGLPSGIRWTGRLHVAPSNGDVLYLSLTRIQPTGLQLFYRSTNGGLRWRRIPYTLPAGSTFRTLTVDATDANRVAIVNSLVGPGGVAISSDGGNTFASLPSGSGFPARSTRGFAWGGPRMYAGLDEITSGSGNAQVFRSNDTGATWVATSTLPASYNSIPHISVGPIVTPTATVVYGIGQASGSSQGFTAINDANTWTQLGALRNPPWISPIATGTLLQVNLNTATPPRLVVQSSSTGGTTFITRTSTGLPDFVDAAGDRNYNPSVTNSVFFAASEGAGLYRTATNGGTMSASSEGYASVAVKALASPNGAPAVIYAAQTDVQRRSHGVFRSINGGATWVSLDLEDVQAAAIEDIQVDPTSSARVYAVGSSWSDLTTANAGIYRSTDNGANWSVIGSGLPTPAVPGSAPIGVVRRLVLDPRSCEAPPQSGPCLSCPLRTGYVVADGVPTPGPNALIVYKSTNLHLSTPTWSAANSGLPVPPVGANVQGLRGRALAIDPVNPQILYLGTELAFIGSSPPTGIINGLFKSTNGGATWTHASNGLPSWSGSNTTKLNVFAIAVDPSNPSTVYAAAARSGVDRSSDASVYKSTDGGASWSNTGDGLVGASIRTLVIDPANPQTIYAGATGTISNPGGVFRSVNGGNNWNSRSIGLPADAVFALLVDRGNTNPQRVLAGTNAGVWELTQIPDGDRDAANTPVEDGAPNGGDGNADGIADSAQALVASVTGPILPIPNAAANVVLRPKGRSNYVTMGGGATLAAKGGGCPRLNDAHVFDADVYPEDVTGSGRQRTYPLGLISVSIPNCTTFELRVTFHDAELFEGFDTLDWSWRNFGPNTRGDDGSLAWYPFIESASIDPQDPRTWILTLDASAIGNWRSDDESILFRGGPAYLPERIFRDGFEP
jgi:hypothetical protein